MQTAALIGLGSNRAFGSLEPDVLVMRAAAALERFGTVRLSPLYGSESWPDPSAPAYVNAVARIDTALTPEALLEALLAIESGFARRRDPAARYAPRTLDLDLLAMGDLRRQTSRLVLPHPRLHERGFVLLPLADVAPDFVHPVTGESLAAMTARLPSVGAWRLRA